MPEAESFNALGKGNGFPFCPAKGDVSGFDYWVTLGGFKKTDGGSPSQAQIDLSLSNAMKLWWNLNGIIFDDLSSIDPVDETIYVEMDKLVLHEDGGYDYPNDDNEGTFLFPDDLQSVSVRKLDGTFLRTIDETLESSDTVPLKRACYDYIYTERRVDDDMDALVLVSAEMGTRFSNGYIYRMYDGSTNDEDNFIGYGWSGFWVFVSGDYEFELRGRSVADDTGDDMAVEYTSLSNIPLLAVGVDHTIGDISVITTVDLENWIMQSEAPDLIDTISIDSLDFYTYT